MENLIDQVKEMKKEHRKEKEMLVRWEKLLLFFGRDEIKSL